MSYSNLDIFMKEYEGIEAKRTLVPGLPVCIRLDGRAFHNVTKNCLRPFDHELREVMCRVTTALMEECNAVIGYTQSDEITLVLKPMAHISDYYFGGRIQKICSMLSAVASVKFNYLVHDAEFTKLESRIGKRTAYFDCRAWNVPHMDFAALVLSWRQADSIKNAISMIAQTLYPHKELLNKNSDEKLEMIKKAGYTMTWNPKAWDSDMFFSQEAMDMQGTFIVRKLAVRKLTQEELDNLPPKHAARQNPDMTFTRHVYVRFAGIILRNITNQAGYLFGGEVPKYRADACPNEIKYFELVENLKKYTPEQRERAKKEMIEAGIWDKLNFGEITNLLEPNGNEESK
ncbi:MAG: tRNA(His) guanylyltransferase Thg1 family protein [Bacteroidaceae bacterium]|nr:tRNA(His) guanylyltransferase Thg1 family protein [Bacteroidaceae bacterium]